MIRPLTRTAAALAGAVLLLSACDSGPGTARPAPHPVFSEPLARQVHLALRHTQKAGGAELRQTVTFTSGEDRAVQTLTGRLDFAGSRGSAISRWHLTPDFPHAARETILGTPQGPGTGDAVGRYTVDTAAIHYRAGSAGYWLRYAGDVEPLWGIDSISHLRGTEGAIGGTLLEVLSGVRPAAQRAVPGGGRSYRADFPLTEALELFPYDLRGEFVPAPLYDHLPSAPVPLTVEVDHEGRITRARADLTVLLDKKAGGALAGVTALHADLVLGRFGAPEAGAVATPDGRVLDAASAVTPTDEARPGECMDLDTGMRYSGLVARVPCAGPHDGRVLAQHPLTGSYPGVGEARERAGRACAGGTDRPRSGSHWYTWSSQGSWTARGEGRATCYLVSTAGATPPARTASAWS
ncbi:hypothetical protein [Streptomyces sp. NPDC058667]|uniref:hypothetical protein n=1 Tax=Streptomyces sp. NPDC058667 TaxID=3346588 RepID=UPI003655EB78